MSNTLKSLILVAMFVGMAVFALPGKVSQGLAQNDLPLYVKQPSPKSELPAFAENQLIVKFRSNAALSAIKQFKAGHGATEIRKSKSGRFITLALPVGSDVLAKAEIFKVKSEKCSKLAEKLRQLGDPDTRKRAMRLTKVREQLAELEKRLVEAGVDLSLLND